MDLRVVLRDAEINEQLPHYVQADLPVRDLQVHFAEDGVHVTGSYRAVLGMGMPFETVWHLIPEDEGVRLRLAQLSAGRLPAGMFRSTLLAFLRGELEKVPGVSVQEDSIKIEVMPVLRERGLPFQARVSQVLCSPGQLVVEALVQALSPS
jgi:hypothetical protein